mmetsp:Transcript_26340/g.47261  ORF Transcript_26340/g.47261 Transcript_26340/m.47261 type:complete len:199 (-) Transcript_26340:42-638(-)
MGGQFNKFTQQVDYVTEQTESEYFARGVGFGLKFKVILNTRFKLLTKLIWRLPGVTFVRVRAIENGEVGKHSTRYLNLAEFDRVFRILFNILPLLKADKIADLKLTASLADSTDFGEGLCAICLERQSDIVLSCLHNFCSTCIDKWSVKDQSCPMCRMEIEKSQGFLMLNSGQQEFEENIREAAREIREIIGGSSASL